MITYLLRPCTANITVPGRAVDSRLWHTCPGPGLRGTPAPAGSSIRCARLTWHDRAMTVSNPSSWRLAPGVVRLRDGRFAGGSPFRVIRLSDRGIQELNTVLGTGTAPASGTSAAALIH